jgi:hypothetical protein
MRKVFESGQASFRNQTAAGIGLNLHVRAVEEPAVLRRLAQDHQGRGKRQKTYEYDAEGHRREE